MKKIFLVFTLVIAVFCILSLTNKHNIKMYRTEYRVTGSVMQTMSYCGGAKPSQKNMDDARKPSGIPFAKLFIKENTINVEGIRIIDTIQADVNGNFSIMLHEGNYCVIEEWKTKPLNVPLNNKWQQVDSFCFKKLYEACDYTLRITADMHDLKIIFHRYCFYNSPCISYKGPLPH